MIKIKIEANWSIENPASEDRATVWSLFFLNWISQLNEITKRKGKHR